VVQGILVDSLRFGGLIFTDALSMQGVARYYRPGEVDVRALMAGNDVLLFSQDVPRAVRSIKDALQAGAITQSELDRHVFKILLAKEHLGLHQNRNTDPAATERLLASPDGARLRRDLYRAALTLVQHTAYQQPSPTARGLCASGLPARGTLLHPPAHLH
jgi:beta-glucosidase-like glycosyl hydrolase